MPSNVHDPIKHLKTDKHKQIYQKGNFNNIE